MTYAYSKSLSDSSTKDSFDCRQTDGSILARGNSTTPNGISRTSSQVSPASALSFSISEPTMAVETPPPGVIIHDGPLVTTSSAAISKSVRKADSSSSTSPALHDDS